MTKRKRKTESVERTSPSLVAEQVERLKEIFPEAVTEGKVDFEKLKATLGEIVDDRSERYSFTWAGKKDAIRLLQVQSRATLKPCPDESVNWETTKNLFIEGENLEVLKLLYKSYAGRVKMIYIDPPYNTGNDFIYPDNFADPLDTYLKLTGQKDSEGNLLTSNPETSGRYHSAWLTMIYPRLFVARQLLGDNGVIFISNDDNEITNLKKLCDEVFGEENFITDIIWEKRFTRNNDAKLMSSVIDHILLYRKGDNLSKLREPRSEKTNSIYTNPDNDQRGSWTSVSYISQRTKEQRPNLSYSIRNPFTGKEIEHPVNSWKYSEEQCKIHAKENRHYWGEKGGNRYPRLKRFLSELDEGVVPINLWHYKATGTIDDGTKAVNALMGKDVFDYPKPISLLKRMMKMSASGDEEIIIDFFAGSCTTAHAVLDLNREDAKNRRFVMVQLPEPTPENSQARNAGYNTISEIGKERLRRVIKNLTDEDNDKLDFKAGNEDLGFRVFKLDESNYRQWSGVEERDDEKYSETMEMFNDPLLPGWKPEDVIWEVAIKEGYSLSSTVEDLNKIKKSRFWRVIDPDREQSFLICLDKELKDEAIKELKLGKEDLFICRDIALTDEQAANLALQCNLKTI